MPMRILRYLRVSSTDQNLDRQKSKEDKSKYDFILEEKVSGKTELFEREKGSIIKELVLEGKVDCVSIVSVDRISRNLKDLLSVLDFLHNHGVALQIDNLGITSLIDGKVNPSIMIIIQMMGAFAQLETEWRAERQAQGIQRAREKGVYRMREHHRRNETMKEFINKSKNKKAIDLIIQHPTLNNRQIAELAGVHYNTITKIRKVFFKTQSN